MTGAAGDVEPVAIEEAAAPLSATLSVAAAGAAALLASTTTDVGLLVGLAAIGVVAVGVNVRSRTVLGVGTACAFGAVTLAALGGGGVAVVVGATLATVLAWDFGDQSLDLGARVGRGPSTWRGELGHAAASLGVGLAAAVAAIVVYRAATAGLTTTALVALAAGAILLMTALRN